MTTFRPEWLASATAGRWRRQAPTTGPLPTAVHMGSYHEAVQRAAPSVVNIFTSKERCRAIRYSTIQRSGASSAISYPTNRSALQPRSGVIVSASGFVITNHHVVEAADEIEVALADGKKLLAKVVGNDPETDLRAARQRRQPARDHLRLFRRAQGG